MSKLLNDEEKDACMPREEQLEKLEGNPKIMLGSRKVIYGCQTWWSPIESLGVEKDG